MFRFQVKTFHVKNERNSTRFSKQREASRRHEIEDRTKFNYDIVIPLTMAHERALYHPSL